MAGVQALINQKKNAAQGNPNPRLYSLAKSVYGPSGNSACNSSTVAGSCAFHDITLGDMDVNCSPGSPNCYDPANARNGGVLSTSTSSFAPAYSTANGWDFSTGIGSINVTALVNQW
jgi:subtilase family serine protease